MYHTMFKIKPSFIVTLLLVVVMLLNFVSVLSVSPGYWDGITGQAGNCFIVFVAYFITREAKNDTRNERNMVLIIVAVWLFSVFSGIIQGATSILKPSVLLLMLSNGFIAYIIATKTTSVGLFKLLFYGVSLYFLILCFVMRVDTLSIFSHAAGGMMGTIVICFAFLVHYIEYRESKKITILPCIIVLSLSIYSLSRASLLSASVYFATVIFFVTRGIRRKYLRNIFLLVVIFLLSFFIVQSWNYISSWEMYARFEKEGFSLSGRENIWLSYINDLSIASLFIGRTIDEFHQLAGFVNPHNSFIAIHSQIGIFAIVVYFFVIRAIVSLLKKNPFVAIMLVCLCLRCFFDSPFFFNDYDFLMYILIFEKELKTRQAEVNLQVALL